MKIGFKDLSLGLKISIVAGWIFAASLAISFISTLLIPGYLN